MFGIDFSELMVIMLVALIVIGPERLPKVARTLGFLWGRAQRYVNGVKADIARDMALDEFRKMTEQVQTEVKSAELAVRDVTHTVDRQVQQLNDTVQRSAQTLAPTAVDNSPPGDILAQNLETATAPLDHPHASLEMPASVGQHESPVT
jgi:sec-independent protein translocase protein TatB